MQPSASVHRKTSSDRGLRPRFERLCEQLLRTDASSVMLYALVGAALIFGDANRVSLIMGGATSWLGLVLRILAAGYGYKAGQLRILGPYRWLRHPYLLGTLLLYVGVVVAARNVYVAALTIICMLLILREKFISDEGAWRRSLGRRWTDYQAYVPAFLPRLLPLPADTEKYSFSIALALFGEPRREAFAAVRLGLIFLALYGVARPSFASGLSGDLFKTAVVITTVGYPIVRLVYYGALVYARTTLHARSRLSRSTKPAQ